MIKIAHEAPKSIFKYINSLTDYTYLLVHLLEEDSDYLRLAEQAKESGREIILDNSIFELGTSFDADKFGKWISYLKPDWYIIPDELEDLSATMSKAIEWKQNFRHISGMKIGVIQGKTYEEFVTCYKFMDEYINATKIAISFDYSYYEESFPHPNKHVSWMLGRVKLLGDLERDGIINKSKPHHLLGVSLPIEGMFYRNYDWISSVDTSNPIVAAIKEVRYKQNLGLLTKDSQKLIELINTPCEDIDSNLVRYNIDQFRKYWNG